jgi:hypothetical protein
MEFPTFNKTYILALPKNNTLPNSLEFEVYISKSWTIKGLSRKDKFTIDAPIILIGLVATAIGTAGFYLFRYGIKPFIDKRRMKRRIAALSPPKVAKIVRSKSALKYD